MIYLGPTCNKFDHFYVDSQWNKCKEIFRNELLDVFQAPLVGAASDGDSPRRKLMEEKSTSKEGDRYNIKSQNFTLSCCVERNDVGIVYCLNIMNQDYIHNGKKLTYPLDHPTRQLYVGNHLAHHNHLFLVRESFDMHMHGLLLEDVVRKDRQNWASAQRLMFPRVQQCLKDLETGEKKEDVVGTRMYLHICYLYVEIFCSLSQSLLERITNASVVANFLRILRSWVHTQIKFHYKTVLY